ncbi:GD15442 [Drosophila simulans]|uniref:GD15442 n=1 Tax=Drosophila simulans TaxID=7240 RepID=B4NSM3_DROSI|nr:GD15442 [Drosophila simulans]
MVREQRTSTSKSLSKPPPIAQNPIYGKRYHKQEQNTQWNHQKQDHRYCPTAYWQPDYWQPQQQNRQRDQEIRKAAKRENQANAKHKQDLTDTTFQELLDNNDNIQEQFSESLQTEEQDHLYLCQIPKCSREGKTEARSKETRDRAIKVPCELQSWIRNDQRNI